MEVKKTVASISSALDEMIQVTIEHKNKIYGWVFCHNNGVCLLKRKENDILLYGSWDDNPIQEKVFDNQNESIKEFIRLIDNEKINC